MKIEFLNFIISRINVINTKLQAQKLPIYELKIQLKNCFTQILLLIVKPEKISEEFQVIIQQDWQEETVQTNGS